MNQYFFKITKEERENILDKHKTLYDGYATNQTSSNMSPLYVQDLANDKGGITINSKGEVGKYNNKLYIKESKDVCEQCGSGLVEGECMECGYKMNEDSECMECGSKMYEDEMEEGIYDVEDLGNAEFDYTEEELGEGFMDDLKGAFGYRSKPDIKPYVADAVKSIISNIKSAKTEGQLDSALQQYFNLIETNKEELNRAYVERIMGAYRRKADELGNYLRKNDIQTIMNDVEPELEFNEDIDMVKESIKESLNWFEKFKKYN
jgi:hypothetical protein